MYPPGDGWTRDPYAAPLRFVYGPADGKAAIAQLTTDAMRAVRAGGSFAAPAQRSVAVQGTVLGVTAGRGLVQLTRGASGMGSVWTDLVAPDVDEACVLTKGMAIAGTLDLDSRRIDVSPMLVAAGAASGGNGNVTGHCQSAQRMAARHAGGLCFHVARPGQ